MFPRVTDQSFGSILGIQRGITMAPRIQVYKAIACQILDDSSDSLSQPSTAMHLLTDCSGSDVAAKAAKIQAGAFVLLTSNCR